MLDFILHLDISLAALIAEYGAWVYLLLFAVIFIETGFIVLPFLPGDSLLFAAGTFAGAGTLNIYVLLGLLFIAAVAGDTCNYFGGKTIGLKALTWRWRSKTVVNPKHIAKTQDFFSQYGAKTIVLARFIPIVRTFAPFVAGMAKMPYRIFITYNLIGGLVWVALLTLAGFYFGQLPFIKAHFEKVVLAIVALSLIPIILELIKGKTGNIARNKGLADF